MRSRVSGGSSHACRVGLRCGGLETSAVCGLWALRAVSGFGSRAQVSDLGGVGPGVCGVWCRVWVRFLFRVVWGLVFGLVFVWCGAVKCNLLALKLQDVQQRMRNLRPQDSSGPM